MAQATYTKTFEKKLSKIRHEGLQKQLYNQIVELQQNPLIGKPMRYDRKGTQELYVGSFRLSYHFDRERNLVTFLDFYHKDEQ